MLSSVVFLLIVCYVLARYRYSPLLTSPAQLLTAALFQGLVFIFSCWKHPKLSAQARVMKFLMSIANPFKVHLSSDSSTLALWRFASKAICYVAPNAPNCTVEELEIHRVKVYRILAKHSKGKIFYLHGGGFVFGDFEMYRGYMESLALRTGFEVIYIDYDLAPDRAIISKQVDQIIDVIKHIGYDPENTLIIGDSAGGGLTLLTAQRMNLEKMPRVAALGLICPFVDLTVSNSIGLKNELSDYMLSSATLKLMGFMACGRDKKQLNDPYFNAFFGSWDNLPHLTIAVSDSEILYGDSLSIHEIANNKKIPSTLMARSQMGHIWMIFDGYVPEATEANDKFIADMLRCCTE